MFKQVTYTIKQKRKTKECPVEIYSNSGNGQGRLTGMFVSNFVLRDVELIKKLSSNEGNHCSSL
jgi:hypothetical protein